MVGDTSDSDDETCLSICILVGKSSCATYQVLLHRIIKIFHGLLSIHFGAILNLCLIHLSSNPVNVKIHSYTWEYPFECRRSALCY
ncbi:hypothetical protein K450DRAFT_242498 [Umbelopsis ramanniana AG]|uniref:Uncharacterized protein n=1 Tax=Umbelopsis ramanniana AG TaxID=1314678 RepID=A0AAD5E9C0_UMBRA|nr:uncharacterized protein K450DRAFT_242498 [Umbelopsis ramanniana AG]KAI8579279.1 hypothetical protein K450DRAFT_242498 [Umbelopsis ramanniana AG]